MKRLKLLAVFVSLLVSITAYGAYQDSLPPGVRYHHWTRFILDDRQPPQRALWNALALRLYPAAVDTQVLPPVLAHKIDDLVKHPTGEFYGLLEPSPGQHKMSVVFDPKTLNSMLGLLNEAQRDASVLCQQSVSVTTSVEEVSYAKCDTKNPATHVAVTSVRVENHHEPVYSGQVTLLPLSGQKSKTMLTSYTYVGRLHVEYTSPSRDTKLVNEQLASALRQQVGYRGGTTFLTTEAKNRYTNTGLSGEIEGGIYREKAP